MKFETNELFSRMFEKWYWQIAENNFSKNEMLIIMALAQNLEADENGRLYAWRSREELARLTGMTTGSVSSAIHRLTKPNPAKGRNIRGLELKSAGHRNRCSVYYVMPDTPIEVKLLNNKNPHNGKPKARKRKRNDTDQAAEPERELTPTEIAEKLGLWK